MGIHQPRQDHFAAQIEHLRAVAFGLEHLAFRADAENFSVLYGQCLYDGELVVDGDDLTVDQHQVCSSVCVALVSEAARVAAKPARKRKNLIMAA